MNSLCGVFGVSKQAFYQHEDSYLKYLCKERFVLSFIGEVRSRDPGIGGRKLWYLYRQQFQAPYAVGRDRFEKIVSVHNLHVRRPRRTTGTTDSRHGYPRYPDLTRTLLPDHPNQLWVADISYIALKSGQGASSFCFLSILMDAYTHEIIGYCLGHTLEASYTLQALEMGMQRIQGCDQIDLIHHSDRGVQYACSQYTGRLRQCKGIRISMTQSGDPKENAMAERVNGIIKNELLRGMEFTDIEQVRIALKTAIDFYNYERPHMSLDMKTPTQVASQTGVLKKKWVSYKQKYMKTV